MTTQTPTTDELAAHRLTAFKGIDVGLGQSDPGVAIAAKLEAQHPGHLILIQAGTFLHGYDATAHALATLKGYKLKLVGTADAPHLRRRYHYRLRQHESGTYDRSEALGSYRAAFTHTGATR